MLVVGNAYFVGSEIALTSASTVYFLCYLVVELCFQRSFETVRAKGSGRAQRGHLSISEEELRTILVTSESEGISDSEETAMIQVSILKLWQKASSSLSLTEDIKHWRDLQAFSSCA